MSGNNKEYEIIIYMNDGRTICSHYDLFEAVLVMVNYIPTQEDVEAFTVMSMENGEIHYHWTRKEGVIWFSH